MSTFIARRCLHVLFENDSIVIGPWFIRLELNKTFGTGHYRRLTLGRPARGT